MLELTSSCLLMLALALPFGTLVVLMREIILLFSLVESMFQRGVIYSWSKHGELYQARFPRAI